MFIFKALNGLAPAYLSRDFNPSWAQLVITVIQPTSFSPEVNVQTVGWLCFCGRCPKTLEQVTPDIRTITGVTLFKSKLETYLFGMAFTGSNLWLFKTTVNEIWDQYHKIKNPKKHQWNIAKLALPHSWKIKSIPKETLAALHLAAI